MIKSHHRNQRLCKQWTDLFHDDPSQQQYFSSDFQALIQCGSCTPTQCKTDSTLSSLHPYAWMQISLFPCINLITSCLSVTVTNQTHLWRTMTQNHRKIWQFQILIIPSSSLTQSVHTNISGKTSSACQTGQWELQLLPTVDLPTLSKRCRICQLLSSWGFVVKQPGVVHFTTSRQILLLNQLEESRFYFWLPERNLVVSYPPGEHSFPSLLYCTHSKQSF